MLPLLHGFARRVVIQTLFGDVVNGFVAQTQIELVKIRLLNMPRRVEVNFHAIDLRVSKIQRPRVAVINGLNQGDVVSGVHQVMHHT